MITIRTEYRRAYHWRRQSICRSIPFYRSYLQEHQRWNFLLWRRTYERPMDTNIWLLRRWVSTNKICTTWFIFQCRAVLFTIYLGAHYLNEDEPSRVRLATDFYILHPEYNPLTLENDIGLIQLRMPVTFTSKFSHQELHKIIYNRVAAYIKPINYLPYYHLEPNTAGIMTMGWGQTSDGTDRSTNSTLSL